MANGKLMCASVFLLVLIFSYGIISTEERLTRTDLTNQAILLHRKVLENEVAAGSAPPTLTYESVPDDNYRPTTPGHSPGAGHNAGHSGGPE
ncbi:hypothetical protein PRUPE_1G440600 [Prunus persica]|uniref:Uncharacterized protein n=1 Tax=Prunus persica TaxID=3760 RepID=M5Y6F0_PRUPE|nr:hypothetical protein PRUPE_1G440600 [Prunus persica]